MTAFSSSASKATMALHERVDVSPAVPLEPPVSFNASDATMHREACAIVCRWLADHKYSATLQIFRDEINAHVREDHAVRKAARGIAKGVEEGNWDAAYAACKKLDGIEIAEFSFVSLQLARQHFLELVDEGDAQRAFTFFLRRIKPSEEIIGKAAFQQLTYLLTCRSVADAAAAYPELRGWSPAGSRAALVQRMSARLDDSMSAAYTHDHRLDYCYLTSFEVLARQALSYQLLEASHPTLVAQLRPLQVSSLLKPLHLQAPPLHRIVSTNVGTFVKTCQPFLHVPAVAVGTASGDVFWCTLQTDHTMKKERLLSHAGRVWSSAGTTTLLATCGGRTMIGISILSRQIVREVHCESEPLDVAVASDGSMMVCGTAGGEIIMADLSSASDQPTLHRFGSVACTSIALNLTATTLYAGFKDGSVRIVDVATSIITRTMTPPIAAEVSSVALSPTSMLLLAAYKNNTIRVWNIVTGHLETGRYGGYINQSKSFVRAIFGSLDHHILSGSEDGNVCFWHRCEADSSDKAALDDATNPTPVLRSPDARLSCHASMVSDLKVYGRLLVTCSEDGTIAIFVPEGTPCEDVCIGAPSACIDDPPHGDGST